MRSGGRQSGREAKHAFNHSPTLRIFVEISLKEHLLQAEERLASGHKGDETKDQKKKRGRWRFSGSDKRHKKRDKITLE